MAVRPEFPVILFCVGALLTASPLAAQTQPIRATGDTQFSDSAEARAMSPPHWGSDQPVWPTPHPGQRAGCETPPGADSPARMLPAGAESQSRFQPPPAVAPLPGSAPGILFPNQSTGSLRLHQPAAGRDLLQLPAWPARPPASAVPTPAGGGRQPGGQVAAGGRYPLFAPQTGALPTGRVQPQDPGVSVLVAPLDGPSLGSTELPPGVSSPPAGVIFFPLPGEGTAAPAQQPPLTPAQDPYGPAPPALPWQTPGPQSSAPSPAECADWERGFRSAQQTVRPQVWDDGTAYDFEQKKKHYPPMREILATGRYFGMAEWQALKPFHLGNSAFVVQSGLAARAVNHDFDFEAASRFRLGFESKYGPGIELQYFQFDHLSDTVQFTSDGVSTISAGVGLLGTPNQLSLTAGGVGQTLLSQHDMEIHSLGAMFFKEVKLPISRVNGIFGVRYVSVAQNMEARLLDGGGGQIGGLVHRQDLRAAGPTLGLEYYRPVGHTPLELVGSFGGGLLFGNRDQYVSSSGGGDFQNIGSNEFLVIGDFYGGLQYVRNWAEKRSWYARLGFQHQVWLGGGTAVDPAGDFGLRGVSFGLGWNR